MSKLVLTNDSMRSLVSKIKVVTGKLALEAVKSEEEVVTLSAACVSDNETVQTVLQAECKKNSLKEGSFACIVKSIDFVVMAEAVISLDDGPIQLILNKTLTIKNKMASMNVDILADTDVKACAVNQEKSRFMMVTGRLDMLHLVKDCSRFWAVDDGKAAIANTVWHITEHAVTASSCSGVIFAYDTVPARVVAGKEWDTACNAYAANHKDEEKGCDIAVPGMFMSYLSSALVMSGMEKVQVLVDNKYLHLLYAEKSMLSIRLSADVLDMKKYIEMVLAPAETMLSLDKGKFELSVKVLKKKLELSKVLAQGVPLHFSIQKGNLISRVGENTIAIPLIEKSENDVSLYMSAALLESALATEKAGNVVLKMDCQKLILYNGSVENGPAAASTKVMVIGVHPEEGKKAEARFNAGIMEEEEEE